MPPGDNPNPNATPPPQRRPHTPGTILVFLAYASALLATDLVSKALAFSRIEPDTAVSVIPKILALHLTENHGAAFGVGSGWRWIFVLASVGAAVAFFIVFLRSGRGRLLLHISLGAAMAGAIGNLYDRLVLGHVRDFLHLFPDVHLPFGLHWPGGSHELYPWIFNVADMCLVLGLIVLAFLLYRAEGRAAKEKKASA